MKFCFGKRANLGKFVFTETQTRHLIKFHNEYNHVQVNDPNWVERKAQVEFAFKFYEFVFFSTDTLQPNPHHRQSSTRCLAEKNVLLAHYLHHQFSCWHKLAHEYRGWLHSNLLSLSYLWNRKVYKLQPRQNRRWQKIGCLWKH